MKIASVKISVPSRVLSNDDIIGLIRENSAPCFEGDLEKALSAIRFLMDGSGANSRHWSAPGEKPIDHLMAAAEAAILESGLNRNDIDLLIYTGIGRGFVEPGGAYFVAQTLGMEKALCFDIMDACMSWSRALEIVHSHFQSGKYKTALVVNAEFITQPGGFLYPANFTLKELSQVTWLFPSFSVGEAATATVLSADPEKDWEFRFSSRNELADLCTVAIPGFEGYCKPSKKIGLSGMGHFTTFGSEIQTKGAIHLLDIFRRIQGSMEGVKVILPHSATRNAWDEFAGSLGVNHLLCHVYPGYGNVGSASIPVSLHLALEQGRLRRGESAVAWIASAGMSFAAYKFTY